jgi:hypothetical protein
MKFLNDEQRLQIGFNFVMDKLDVHTPYGLDEKKSIKPFLDKEKLEGELRGLKAVVDSMKIGIIPYDGIDRVLSKVKDIRGSLSRCREFEVLDDVELFEIKCFCILIDD